MEILMLKEIELLMLAGNLPNRYTATIEIEGTKATNIKLFKEVDNDGKITFKAIPVDCFTAWLKFESNSEERYPNERNFAPVDSFIKYSHEGRKIAETETEKYEQFQKNSTYSIETDAEKREITITLPAGQNQLVLPENWVYTFTKKLTAPIYEWHQKSRPTAKEYDKATMLSVLKNDLIKALKGDPPFEKNREAAINAIIDRIYQICDKEDCNELKI